MDPPTLDPARRSLEHALTDSILASDRLTRLATDLTKTTKTLATISQFSLQLTHQTARIHVTLDNLSSRVLHIASRQKEKAERAEKLLNLVVFGEFDKVVEDWRVGKGLDNGRDEVGTMGKTYSRVDHWGRRADGILTDLMQLMGAEGWKDEMGVCVIRYPIPTKTCPTNPESSAERSGPWVKYAPAKPNAEAAPEVKVGSQVEMEGTGLASATISTKVETSSIDDAHFELDAGGFGLPSSSTSSPFQTPPKDSIEPKVTTEENSPQPPQTDNPFKSLSGTGPPCVLVLAISSALTQIHILNVYQAYERRYRTEHNDEDPPFNIRVDRTHDRCLDMKKTSVWRTERYLARKADSVARKSDAAKKVDVSATTTGDISGC